MKATMTPRAGARPHISVAVPSPLRPSRAALWTCAVQHDTAGAKCDDSGKNEQPAGDIAIHGRQPRALHYVDFIGPTRAATRPPVPSSRTRGNATMSTKLEAMRSLGLKRSTPAIRPDSSEEP